MHNTTATGTFTKYSHSVGISTKEMNVLLHPLEGKPLIVKTKIGSAIFLECWSTEPTKCSKPVVESNVNYTVTVVALATCKQPGRVSRPGFGSRSISEIKLARLSGNVTIHLPATIDPDQDRGTVAFPSRFEYVLRDKDVKKQAVLCRLWILGWHTAGAIACRCEVRCSEIGCSIEILRDIVFSDEKPCRVCLRADPANAAILDH